MMDCEYVSELLTTALESISLPVRPFLPSLSVYAAVCVHALTHKERQETQLTICLVFFLFYVRLSLFLFGSFLPSSLTRIHLYI